MLSFTKNIIKCRSIGSFPKTSTWKRGNMSTSLEHFGVVFRLNPGELITVGPFGAKPKNPQDWVPSGATFLGVVTALDPAWLRGSAVRLDDSVAKSCLISLEQAKKLVKESRKAARKSKPKSSRKTSREDKRTKKRVSGRLSRSTR